MMLASATERCFSIFSGIMLLSPALRSQKMKNAVRTPASTKRRMILQLDHACTVPPHCNASTSVSAMGTLMPKPTQSIFLRMSLFVRCAFSDLRRWPMLKKTTMIPRALPGTMM